MEPLYYDWGNTHTPYKVPHTGTAKRYIFDIESNGFLDVMDRVHCIVIEDFDTGVMWSYIPSGFPLAGATGNIEDGLKKLMEADQLIGHNIISFDLQALRKIYPRFAPKGEILDTLVMTRVIWADIKNQDFGLYKRGKLSAHNIGKHNLESWGERLGELKGTYGKTTDWANFTPEMLEYCKQDVRVNSALFNRIQLKKYPISVLRMEQDIHTICLDQERFGFPFNERKAQVLLAKLLARKSEIYDSLFKQLGPSWVVGVKDVESKRTVKYKDPLRGNEFAGSKYTKVKVVDFNPNSRTHLTKRLMEVFKWVPEVYGDDGTPTLDDEVLEKMELPIAKEIGEFLMLQKRVGQIAEGDQAWLTLAKDGVLHGRVNTMGAITARASHSNPNLAQIPANGSPFGHECRELFEPPKGWKLFGTDASGLELRMLAHYMAAYDKGAYGELILRGDVHTANQLAAGLPTRNNAKTFIYGFLYGAGDEKIGKIVNGSRARGKELKEKFLKNTPALKSLREAVAEKVKATGTLKALDGRILPVRHQHAALNTLLQSAGAIVCKQWCIYMHMLLNEAGFKLGRDYIQHAWVHDELQISYNPATLDNDTMKAFSKKAMVMCTERFKLRVPVDSEGNSGDSYAETH